MWNAYVVFNLIWVYLDNNLDPHKTLIEKTEVILELTSELIGTDINNFDLKDTK